MYQNPPRRRPPRLSGIATVVCLVALCCAGCAEPKPRPLEEIETEIQSLPKLYLTETGKEIISPGNRGLFVDERNGEIAWPAYTCTNPDCPGKPTGGREAYVFIWSDPRFYVTDEGELGTHVYTNAADWLTALEETGGHEVATCPACLTIRKIGNESRAEIEKYSLWVAPYVLPGTDERLAALAAEKQQRQDYIQRRLAGE